MKTCSYLLKSLLPLGASQVQSLFKPLLILESLQLDLDGTETQQHKDPVQSVKMEPIVDGSCFC